jgi:biotin carboxyl carrier protein
VNKKAHDVRVLERNGDGFLVEVNNKTLHIDVKNVNHDEIVVIKVDGKSFQAVLEKTQRDELSVRIGNSTYKVQTHMRTERKTWEKLEAAAPLPRKTVQTFAKTSGEEVTAPISGRVVLLKARIGQKIKKGDSICVLEAMKMQNEIAVSTAGVVKEIRVTEGAVVSGGDVIAVIARASAQTSH